MRERNDLTMTNDAFTGGSEFGRARPLAAGVQKSLSACRQKSV